MTRRSLAALLLALSLLLASGACSGDDGDGGASGGNNQPGSSEVGNEGSGEAGTDEGAVEPEAEDPVLSAQLEADLAGQINDAVGRWMDQSGAPAVSVAVVGPGGFEVSEAFGLADLRNGRQATREDYWRFGSVTKPMTSAVIYHLAAEDRIDLDAPVAEYLGPGWAEGYEFGGAEVGDQLTVKQMLNYTSGFAEYATSPDFFAKALERLDEPIPPREVLDWAVETGPVVEPGTEPSVTTIGHLVAGLLIEEVTGSPAHEVLRGIVFEPAGAGAMALPLAEEPETPVVNGYLGEGFVAAIQALWPQSGVLGNFDEARREAQVEGSAFELFDITVVPQELLRSAGWTGGGLEARAIDVARAIRAVFDGTVLSPDSVRSMTTALPDSVYAQGVVIGEVEGEQVYRQSGVVPGYNSAVMYLPEWNIAVAASSNTEATLVPITSLVEELASLTRVSFVVAAIEAGAVADTNQ